MKALSKAGSERRTTDLSWLIGRFRKNGLNLTSGEYAPALGKRSFRRGSFPFVSQVLRYATFHLALTYPVPSEPKPHHHLLSFKIFPTPGARQSLGTAGVLGMALPRITQRVHILLILCVGSYPANNPCWKGCPIQVSLDIYT